MDIQIFNAKNEVKCTGHGCWLSYLSLGDKLYWRIEDELPRWKEYGDLSDGLRTLESDTRNRKDVGPMIEENWEEAEKAKLELENAQRNDKKLRTAKAK